MGNSAKEFLKRVRDEQKEVRILSGKRENIRLALMPSGIRYDTDKVQSSPKDVLPERVAEMCALDEEIACHIREMEARRAVAMSAIRKMGDPRHRMTLELYYLCTDREGRLHSWEDVAEAMGCSSSTVLTRLHPEALKEFSIFWSGDSK